MKAKIIDLPKQKMRRQKLELPMPLLVAYRAEGRALYPMSSLIAALAVILSLPYMCL